jgi:hypothetical protein
MAFLRFFLQVLLGFFIGFGTAVFLLPDVNINIGLEPSGKQTAGQAERPSRPIAQAGSGKTTGSANTGDSDNTVFGRRTGATGNAVRIDGGQPSAVSPRQETGSGEVASTGSQSPSTGGPDPIPTVQPAEPAPSTPVALAPVDTTPVDFGELCIKPAAWPPIITLNKDTTAEVRQGDEIIAEIPLVAGDKLQVSKVFGDGTVEVRAKGAKFTLTHTLTDLEPQARARLNEISGKPRAPAPQPVVQRPAPSPPTRPAPKEEEPPAQRNPDDLDRKMRSLFGERERR